MSRIERQYMIEQEPKIRAKNFLEVCNGYDDKTAIIEASRCLNCKNPPCVKGCPVNVQIPNFIQLIKMGEFEKAGLTILETNSLPSICGRVCPQEIQCEEHCVRKKMEGAVAIGGLERFVADKLLENCNVKKIEKSNGKSIAVIGGGPSSLTCAADLKKAGFDVTIFEAFHRLGGVLLYGIPEFRLPKIDIVEKEIENVLRLGVKVKLNTVIGKTIMMDELLNDFDAVYIGSGAGLPIFLGIEGESLRGVFSANEYLTRVNLMQAYLENSKTPIKRAKNVVVIGGGNVAMDSARTALRLGEKATVVYRRSHEEMPARAEEIRHAEEEGVSFQMLTSPLKIIGENGQVKSLLCEKMRLGEPDSSGRRSPISIENSQFEIQCDMLIVALGTSPNPIITSSFTALSTVRGGMLVVDESNMTSVENVYAGGDAVTGAATVILAMGAGRNAAKNIIKKIG